MLHQQILKSWPRIRDLAADVRQKYETVKKWRANGIPSKHWPAIIAAARKRGVFINADDFLPKRNGHRRNGRAGR
jgi:hypothetical protein